MFFDSKLYFVIGCKVSINKLFVKSSESVCECIGFQRHMSTMREWLTPNNYKAYLDNISNCPLCGNEIKSRVTDVLVNKSKHDNNGLSLILSDVYFNLLKSNGAQHEFIVGEIQEIDTLEDGVGSRRLIQGNEHLDLIEKKLAELNLYDWNSFGVWLVNGILFESAAELKEYLYK